MTRLLVIEDRPGVVDGFRAEGLALVRTYDNRAELAGVRMASSGLLTVDLALPVRRDTGASRHWAVPRRSSIG